MPEESSRCISEGVTEHVFVQVSETKTGFGLWIFHPEIGQIFSHLFGKRLSKIKSPRVTRCLSFLSFQSLFFLLASYPKFQIHIPFVDTSIFCVHSCLTRNQRLRRLACHLICWALPLEISQCCAWNLNHQFLWHSMLNEGRCGWFYPYLELIPELHTFQLRVVCITVEDKRKKTWHKSHKSTAKHVISHWIPNAHLTQTNWEEETANKQQTMVF